MGSLGLIEEDFKEPDRVIQLGYPPNRIDFLNSESGISFAECFESNILAVNHPHTAKLTDMGEEIPRNGMPVYK